MPLKTRAQAARYLAKIQGCMRLHDWTLELAPDASGIDEGVLAQVGCARGRKHATIAVADSFFAQAPEEQRHVAVHELLHVHHAHPDLIAHEALGPREQEAWTLAMEYAIDGVAAIIAPFLSLPK